MKNTTNSIKPLFEKPIRPPSDQEWAEAERKIQQEPIRRTICGVLREIYQKGDEEIKKLAIEAFVYAKRMNRKLIEYNLLKKQEEESQEQ